MLYSLKNLRKSKGLTQQQLADLAGVSKQSVVAWEKNKAEPSVDSIKKIAHALGITTDELCGRTKPDVVLADDDRLLLIDQIMNADDYTIARLKKYMELLNRGSV